MKIVGFERLYLAFSLCLTRIVIIKPDHEL